MIFTEYNYPPNYKKRILSFYTNLRPKYASLPHNKACRSMCEKYLQGDEHLDEENYRPIETEYYKAKREERQSQKGYGRGGALSQYSDPLYDNYKLGWTDYLICIVILLIIAGLITMYFLIDDKDEAAIVGFIGFVGAWIVYYFTVGEIRHWYKKRKMKKRNLLQE